MQVFSRKENIGDLTKLTPTTAELAASVLTIGGQQYVTSALTLNLGTDIDTGAVANDEVYYVYAIVNTGSVSLVYSLSSVSPLGYSSSKKVAAVATDGSSQILGISSKDNGKVGDVMNSMLEEVDFIEQNGAGWILADGRSVTGKKYESVTGNSSVPDMRGRFLRGRSYGANSVGDKTEGTFENDAFKSHSHTSYGPFINISTGTGAGHFSINNVRDNSTGNAGDTETRPKNITVNIYIKIEDIEV